MDSKKKIGSPPIDIKAIDELNKIIHDTSRLKIVAYLYLLKETDFTFLKNETGFTWGRLASHLDKLQKVGYVTLRKELIQRKRSSKKIPRTYISLTIEGKQAFDKYKESIQQLFHKDSQ